MTKEAGDLLASCMELRDALAGAMRVIYRNATDAHDLVEEFADEMTRIGIVNGIGVRADSAIQNAEGR